MKRIGLGTFAVAVASLAALTGCQQRASNITVDGSSTVYPITEAVAEEFRKSQPTVRVTVGFSGTGGGNLTVTVCALFRRHDHTTQ